MYQILVNLHNCVIEVNKICLVDLSYINIFITILTTVWLCFDDKIEITQHNFFMGMRCDKECSVSMHLLAIPKRFGTPLFGDFESKFLFHPKMLKIIYPLIIFDPVRVFALQSASALMQLLAPITQEQSEALVQRSATPPNGVLIHLNVLSSKSNLRRYF